MSEAERQENTYKLVMELYKMSLEDLRKFKSLAYGAISPAVDELIDKAEAIKQ